jgi:hypothetical protein
MARVKPETPVVTPTVSASRKTLADVWIVAVMVILGVGDTVLVAILFWTYNRSNPLGFVHSSSPISPTQ